MQDLKRRPLRKVHIRCGTPDCEWGIPFSGFGSADVTRYRALFRRHCIERHALDPSDIERICWLDLQALTLTLLDD